MGCGGDDLTLCLLLAIIGVVRMQFGRVERVGGIDCREGGGREGGREGGRVGVGREGG